MIHSSGGGSARAASLSDGGSRSRMATSRSLVVGAAKGARPVTSS